MQPQGTGIVPPESSRLLFSLGIPVGPVRCNRLDFVGRSSAHAQLSINLSPEIVHLKFWGFSAYYRLFFWSNCQES